jgi:hypothetical protein
MARVVIEPVSILTCDGVERFVLLLVVHSRLKVKSRSLRSATIGSKRKWSEIGERYTETGLTCVRHLRARLPRNAQPNTVSFPESRVPASARLGKIPHRDSFARAHGIIRVHYRTNYRQPF